MPRYGKYQITGKRDFRLGGMAKLSTGRMDDGAEIVVRELQEKFLFNWEMRRKFSIGLKIRKKIPPHPNLVWSIGIGWKGFTPFEIMPFVNGTSLQSQLIQDREYVLQHAVGLLLQSAEGIKHVHASGFLHLDVKAGNILLDLTDRDNPEAKITDFDLSMPRRRIKPDKSLRYGTFNYMSPEHLKEGRIGVESDIFAFGVLAYNLYTNEMPFPGSNAAESRAAKTDASFKVIPLEEKNSNIPKKISEVIMRCIERESTLRYSNMRIVVRDLWTASLLKHMPGDKKTRSWELH